MLSRLTTGTLTLTVTEFELRDVVQPSMVCLGLPSGTRHAGRRGRLAKLGLEATAAGAILRRRG
jgi:hypothetical protein